jgi:hypothetical protein
MSWITCIWRLHGGHMRSPSLFNWEQAMVWTRCVPVIRVCRPCNIHSSSTMLWSITSLEGWYRSLNWSNQSNRNVHSSSTMPWSITSLEGWYRSLNWSNQSNHRLCAPQLTSIGNYSVMYEIDLVCLYLRRDFDSFHRFDWVKQQSVKDFLHHQRYVDEWNKFEGNSVRIFRMHWDATFKEYLDWFQSVTRTKLCQRWTDVDYVEIASSNDGNTTYNTQPRMGSHVLAPVLDHVVSFLSICFGFLIRMFLLLPHIYGLV